MKIVGTCSRCYGPVEVQEILKDPVPTCRTCGSVAKAMFGPIIEMVDGPKPTPPDVAELLRKHNVAGA